MAETKDVKRTIPKDLWLRAKAQAILEGKNMRDWLAEAIESKLKRSKSVHKSEELHKAKLGKP